MKFNNADAAFRYYNGLINSRGVEYAGTKALFNVGFTLENPLDNNITAPTRKFKLDYAQAEWKWYMSGDRSIDKLTEIYGKCPKIWEEMADWRGNVNSNYGWQWDRGDQLDKVIAMLQRDPDTRRAVVSIYDGKEIAEYAKDTPCTYAVNFQILNNKLNMSVLMRSNDLWFGFCVDQYCFSMMQKMVADRVGVEIGEYYHHATNLHLYNRHLNLT